MRRVGRVAVEIGRKREAGYNLATRCGPLLILLFKAVETLPLFAPISVVSLAGGIQ